MKIKPIAHRFCAIAAAGAVLASAAALRSAPLSQPTAIQTQPDDSSPVIGILKAGTEPVPAPAAPPAPPGWMAVSVSGPFDGYVQNSDLTKQLDVKPGASIRLEPKAGAGVLAVAEKDDKTRLTGLHGSWTQIRLDKTLTGYIRTSPAPATAVGTSPAAVADLQTPGAAAGASEAAPSSTGASGPRDLAAPQASAAPAASPADTGTADLARPFEGVFASTRHAFTPRRPYDWELADGSGRRIAYLDISRLLLTDQIDNYVRHEVVVLGALKSVKGSKDPVIMVESLRLK